MNKIYVKAENLSVTRKKKRIVDGVSLEIGSGITGLLGKNGAGKTTLIKALCGIGEGISGSVSICGKSSARERARLSAYVPQEGGTATSMSVFEFVLLGRSPYLGLLEQPKKNDRALTSEALERLGISHLSSRVFSTLSGGEKKLCYLARAVAGKADVAFLDEPLAGLDFAKRHELLELLCEGVFESVLVSLHSPDTAYRYCDRIIVLDGGKIIADIDMRSQNADEKYLSALVEIYGESVAFSDESDGKNIIWRKRYAENKRIR